MTKKWRVSEQGIQAIPSNTPHQWGPDAYDFETLDLARFAKHLHRPTKPRAHHAAAAMPKPAADTETNTALNSHTLHSHA